MKAILVNEDKTLRWDNVPDPVIKSDELLVKRATIRRLRAAPNGWDSRSRERS